MSPEGPLRRSSRGDDNPLRRRARSQRLLVAMGTLLVGLAGYLGFVAFVTTDRSSSVGIFALGALTGFASFFSPCSFPLLLTFLARRSKDSVGGALWSSLRVGLGATTLLVVIATVLAAGGAALASVIQFDSTVGRGFRLLVGLTLVGLGLYQIGMLSLRMKWMQAVARSTGQVFDRSRFSSEAGKDFVYGFGYLLAGFG